MLADNVDIELSNKILTFIDPAIRQCRYWTIKYNIDIH